MQRQFSCSRWQNETKQNEADTRAKSFSSSFGLVSRCVFLGVCVCVLVWVFLVCCSFNLANWRYICLEKGKKACSKDARYLTENYFNYRGKKYVRLIFSVHLSHPHWHSPKKNKKKNKNKKRIAECGIWHWVFVVRASDTLCRPSAYGQIQYVPGIASDGISPIYRAMCKHAPVFSIVTPCPHSRQEQIE